jgi:hypothetical protein
MRRPQEPRPEPPRITGYRDLVAVAVGGFSTVYTAYQETLGRTVAVKVLRADSTAARQQFQHECELTGRLTGRANIITVFAAGTTEDNRLFIAMQYLPRGSLADRLATTGPLPVEEVSRIGAAIAGALAAAHAEGILHRDIKPGNILVTDQGEPVLSDFGIASLVNPAGGSVDAFTRGHTAPELVDGEPPTIRSDLYALGSTLYTLLTGVPPAVPPAVPPVDGSSGELSLPDVPADFAALLRRTLATDPRQRPASAADFAALLGGDQQPSAPPTEPRAVAAVAAVGAPATEEPTRLRANRVVPPGTVATGKRRRRTMTVVAIAVGVAALVAVGSAFAGTLGHPEAGPTAATQPTATGSPAPVVPAATPTPAQTTTARRERTTPPASPPGAPPALTASPQPSTAKAEPTPATVCTPSGCAGKAYFVANGEHLFVCDEKSDAYGVIAVYTRTDVPGQSNEAANRNGYGTCIDHDMNMPEGAKITFKVCLADWTGPVFSCSATITPSA